MQYLPFLKPGDEVKVDTLTPHFHKNQTYTISGVFHDKGKPIIYLKDKHGYDVRINHGYERYILTSKSYNASERRMIMQRLKYAAKSQDNELYISIGRGGKDSIYYRIIDATNTYNSAHFISMNKFIFISRYMKNEDKSVYDKTELQFKDIEGVTDYFIKELKLVKAESYMLHVNGVGFDKQRDIDFANYLLSENISVHDDTLMKLPTSHLENEYLPGLFEKYSLYVASEILFDLLFDTKRPTVEQKQFISTVIDAYIASPSSHGATATAKLLLGKSKKVSEKQTTFVNVNPLNLSYDMMFGVTDNVETFCYSFKAFSKDKTLLMDQSNVEFTARAIGLDKINEIKKLLS